jgi:hypothetical protein
MANIPAFANVNEKVSHLITLVYNFRRGIAVGGDAGETARVISFLVLDVYEDITRELDLSVPPGPFNRAEGAQTLLVFCSYSFIAALAGQLPKAWKAHGGDSRVFPELYNHVRNLVQQGTLVEGDKSSDEQVRCICS